MEGSAYYGRGGRHTEQGRQGVYIVGIDPGKTTGLVVIEADENGWSLISRADIAPDEDIERGRNLWKLHDEIGTQITTYKADVVAMEELLAYRQATADEKVEAQAVVAMAAYRARVPLITYAPVTIRSTICRDGRADVQTITKTLRYLARLPKQSKRGEAWSAHQYDALAVALCHVARSGYVLDRCREAAWQPE